MSPVIRISDSTFKRLQKYATPLVDTTPTVIDKLLDFCDSHPLAEVTRAEQATQVNVVKSHAAADVDSPIEFDPIDPPSLRHTKVLRAEFDGRNADGWNDLVRIAHERAMETLGSFESLRSASRSNIVKGQPDGRQPAGFHPAQKIGISIQYTDADKAWQNILHLAKNLGCSVRVQFEWRNKEGAAYPGRSGVMSFKR